MSTLPDPEGRKLLRIEVRNSQTPIEKKPEWIRTTAKAGENYQDMRSRPRVALRDALEHLAGGPFAALEFDVDVKLVDTNDIS